MKNIITINLILTELGLKKFKTIPTFKNLLHNNQLDVIVIGENVLKVNHTTYGRLKRIVEYDSLNMTVSEI